MESLAATIQPHRPDLLFNTSGNPIPSKPPKLNTIEERDDQDVVLQRKATKNK